MRSVIAHLFQESNGFNSTISDYIINLLEKGKVLTCKVIYDNFFFNLKLFSFLFIYIVFIK